MGERLHTQLSKRERQIMDIVYRIKRATAKEVRERMADPPSYSTVRKLLQILEGKGFLRHTEEGIRYAFTPTIPHENAVRSAIIQLVGTYFNNSFHEAVTALIEHPGSGITDADLDRLIDLIEKRKKGGPDDHGG
jgi:predicted transcriptional regulator